MPTPNKTYVHTARVLAWLVLTLASVLFLLIVFPNVLTNMVVKRDTVQGVCLKRDTIEHFDSYIMLSTRELAGCEIGSEANTIRAFGWIFLGLFAVAFVLIARAIRYWVPRRA